MTQELHYTSVPRGLRPGTRGFCTVAATPRMTGPLIERLEGLSAYQPVYSPEDPSASLNPIVYSHLRLSVAGKVVSVLSRIGPAGLDYSGRPSKYAHHVVLEGNERPEGGPAWLLSQPGFMQAAWTEEPRELPAGRIAPQGDLGPGVAHTWQKLTGDGGWAGVLAESFLFDPKRLVIVAFQPGLDVLPLFAEAMALLPISRRWEVEFSTYFHQLPQGVTCAWRGVLEGSEEGTRARRLPNALFLDFCRPVGRAEGGALVQLARTGEQIRHEPGISVSTAEAARHTAKTDREFSAQYAGSPVPPDGARPPSPAASHDLVPELARLTAKGRFGSEDDPTDRARRQRSRVVRAMIATGFILPLVAVCWFFLVRAPMKLLGFDPQLSKEIMAERDKASNAKKKVETAQIEAEKEVARRKSEQAVEAKSATIKTEVPVDAEPNFTPPKTDKPPEKPVPMVAEESHPIEPGVEFFELPPLHGSDLGESWDRHREISPKNGIKSILSQYYMSTFNVVALGSDMAFEVSAKTKSDFGKLRFATLEAQQGKLEFSWTEQANVRQDLAESLRDGVLRIKGDKKEYYMLLRNPGTVEARAFDLAMRPAKKASRAIRTHELSSRHLEFPWANENAIKGTKWNLGVRCWEARF